ncbi:hypothetical protein [Rhodobacter calidifons]|uniref:Glycosyl transferase family 2 n=1 Tax=Rhodobacter calidifons TaxID=2715277 RepID=A0ABX0G2K7_9RHOB|nr:hypothetical protein [Rhodobacter calidifons]NHB75430.1 hypothetical protein [Rhodobacter calidifons]
MIVANLATYPPRRDGMLDVVRALAPQVDRMNVVLNEYTEIPAELAAFANVHPVIPDENTMDVGKFYVEPTPDDIVFYVDDDIYPTNDFVATTVDRFHALGPGRWLGGYHGSIYVKPSIRQPLRLLRFSRRRIAGYRRVFSLDQMLESAVVVDQLGTGCAIILGADAPPYSYMRDSRKFVDVRLARWCHEQGITPVCLPRQRDWIGTGRYGRASIHRTFTMRNPAHVAEEIWTYAFKVPGRGAPPPRISE